MKNFFAVSSQALVSWAFLLQEVCLLSAFYYEATRLVYKRCWHPFYHQKEAKKFFQNDFVKNDDDGSLVQNPISIKLRKCILDCLTFFSSAFLRCLGWDKVMAPSIYSLSAIQLTQEMNASMFPTSKCTNFPSKKLKWFLGKKKKLRHFAVCTAISCLVSKEDLSLLFLLYDFSGIRTTGDSTSVTFASLTKVATCAKFLPSHPRLYSRFSMSKVSKCNAK